MPTSKPRFIEVAIPYKLTYPDKKINSEPFWKKDTAMEASLRDRLLAKASDLPWFPLKVTLTRVAPRVFDDDLLKAAMGQIRGVVVSFLFSGVDPERAAHDPRVSWEYIQEKGRDHYVIVKIEADDGE